MEQGKVPLGGKLTVAHQVLSSSSQTDETADGGAVDVDMTLLEIVQLSTAQTP